MSKFNIGELIDDRYVVLSVLGEGGMGLVYKVKDTLLTQNVALKTLLPDFTQHEEVLIRFINEAKVSLKLTHPNIIRVYDIRHLDKLYYITMEYIEGISLNDWLQERHDRDFGQVLDILEKVCSGLEYAHSMGTFHRDIKPSNIMLTEDGRVLLLDFGLAKLADGMGKITRLGGAGTPNYMPPEQKRGGDIDQRADIFAVGVLTFEMLTGGLPQLTQASQLNPKLNSGVDKILAKAIAKTPSERYGNILTFLEDLKNAIASRKVDAKDISKILETSETEEKTITPKAKIKSKPTSLPGMVVIPGGHFWMGSAHEESKRESEKPRHRVVLPTYYMDKHPVTNQMYYSFMKDTGHPEPTFWSDPKFNHPQQPVVGVSWDDAMAYAKWANKRLPTEAEWERAAKGTKNLIYPWGNSFSPGMANIDFTMDRTSPVGKFSGGIGDFGCLDMIGNVWEWCFDWYDEKYYSMSLVENPLGPDTGQEKVIKGGAWDTVSFNARNAFRFSAVPNTKSPNIGFRCVADG
jgi:serine/threonine-protein kinase